MTGIAVFGLGYVGSVTAACMARDGHRVVGVDIDAAKVATMNSGNSPVSEPGLHELVSRQVGAGRLGAAADTAAAVRESELAIVTVGTPSAPDGSVDSSSVENVLEGIGRVLRDTDLTYTIVIRSTLLPGVLEERLVPILEEAAGCRVGERVHLCNNPEFLRETTAIRDFDHPPFVLVGASDKDTANRVLALYDKIGSERIVTDSRTAAMVKYTCNAFHALKVDFANEIGVLAKELGANGQEVMRIMCRDTNLNISSAYLRPGFAFGGSCLPKDLKALVRFAQRQAIQVEMLSSILPSNESHLGRALRMICETGRRRIGMVGLSFKAGTDDLRESPQVVLAEALLGRGIELRIYDPGVQVSRLIGGNQRYVDRHLPHLAALLVDDLAELFWHAELLVLGTNIADTIDLAPFDGEIVDLRRDLVVPANRRVCTRARSVGP